MKTRMRELLINHKASILKKSKMYKLLLVLSALLLTSLTGIVSSAQNAPNRGSKLGNAYAAGDFEIVNTTNGNLMLNFPLASLPKGRGETGAGINLIYNSKLYDTRVDKIQDYRYSCANGVCRYFDQTVIEQSGKGGWKYSFGRYDLEFEDRRASYGQNPPACVNQGAMTESWQEMTYVHKLRVVFPDGSTHEMIPHGQTAVLNDGFFRVTHDGYVENCGYGRPRTGQPVTYYSIDGTYARLEFSYDNDTNPNNNTWTLYFADGRKVTGGLFQSGVSQRQYDRNGNYIEGLTDQFGRSVSISTNALGEDEIRSKGVGGEELIWKVKWKNIGVAKTYQACPGGLGVCPPEYQRGRLAEGITVVDKITQPQQLGGQSYTFSYNAPATLPASPQTSNGWGEVSGVTLPTGAQITYSYAMDGLDGGTDSWSIKEILRNYPNSKTLAYNQEYDGVSTPTTEAWGYGTSASSSTVSGSDGSLTTNYFGSTDENSWFAGLTHKSVNDTAGTMTENLWAFNCPVSCPSPGPGSAINPYVKTEFTSIKNTVGNYTLTTIKDYTYDKNGNATEVKEYDWMPYGNVPRDQYGQVTGIPTGVAPKRIMTTGFYAATPEASITSTDYNSYIWTTSPKLKRAASWTEIRNGSGTPFSRAEMFYDNALTTGNLTETKAWDSYKNGVNQPYSNPLTTSNSISTTVQYNFYGSPVLTTDAKGYQTQITYGAINTPTGTVSDLYPTQIVSAYGTPIAQTAQTEYDFTTGLPKKITALGNTAAENVVSESVYDALGRPTIGKAAVGTPLEVWTQSSYDDVARTVIVKSDLFVKGDGKKVGVQHYDQLGRVFLTRTLEDFATQSATNINDGIKVQTRYLTGNPYSYQLTSNPYRAATSAGAANEPSMGWTRSKAVNTGKRSEVETFSGAALPAPFTTSNPNTASTGIVSTDVDSDRMLVTDQAGKRRISKTNALGQLVNIWEVKEADTDTEAVTFGNPAIALNGLKTSYSYNTLNNLTTVNQGAQQRTFSYSTLSRLLTAQNPESGTIGYLYDNNGNLTTKTDARLVVTNYAYDALNRVTGRTYSAPTGLTNYQASEPVSYTYDNLPNAKGRLTKVVTGTGATPFSVTEYTSFDIMGRVTGHKQTTDGTAYATAYVYNLSGALVEETYPSTRKVKNVLDNDGDLAVVQSKKNASSAYWDYAQNFTYTSAGAVSSMQLGNGRWESAVFNSRLQPTQIALGTLPNGTDKLKLNFAYNTTGQNDNNGNVLSQTVTVPSETRNNQTYNAFTATQTYTYDALNRIKDAVEMNGAAQTWKQTFQYDRYGNRQFDTAAGKTTTIPVGCPQAVCNPSADTANNKLVGYTYDSAGNTKIDAETRAFTYDGENKQTEVKDAYGNIIGQYFYDGDGKRVKKYVPSTGETTIFVYDASGKMVAEYSTVVASTTEAKVSYLTSDHLGSPRINTDKYGDVLSRHDYQPFGEEIARASYGADTVRKKFTSYERDTESGLDFAEARMYASKLGRFTTTDPSRISIKFNNPQTWNRYNYCLNNPLKYIDSNGKWPTGTHNRIIEGAFDNLRDRSAIERGSKNTDISGINPKTLYEKNAPQHAMTPGSKVRELGSLEKAKSWARNEAVKFIEGNLNEAKNILKPKAGDSGSRDERVDKSLEKFGAAMHTVMDNVSPAHRDFQVYDNNPAIISGAAAGATGGIGGVLGGVVGTVGAAMYQHGQEESREPTQAEMNLMVDELRLNYQQTYGQEAYNQAVSEDQRKLTADRLAKRGTDGMLK